MPIAAPPVYDEAMKGSYGALPELPIIACDKIPIDWQYLSEVSCDGPCQAPALERKIRTEIDIN